jgi:hypothetical protein
MGWSRGAERAARPDNLRRGRRFGLRLGHLRNADQCALTTMEDVKTGVKEGDKGGMKKVGKMAKDCGRP